LEHLLTKCTFAPKYKILSLIKNQ